MDVGVSNMHFKVQRCHRDPFIRPRVTRWLLYLWPESRRGPPPTPVIPSETKSRAGRCPFDAISRHLTRLDLTCQAVIARTRGGGGWMSTFKYENQLLTKSFLQWGTFSPTIFLGMQITGKRNFLRCGRTFILLNLKLHHNLYMHQFKT